MAEMRASLVLWLVAPLLAVSVAARTCTVTSPDDSGPGSLRDVLMRECFMPGDLVTFDRDTMNNARIKLLAPIGVMVRVAW